MGSTRPRHGPRPVRLRKGTPRPNGNGSEDCEVSRRLPKPPHIPRAVSQPLSAISDENVEQAIADYAFQKLEGKSDREREIVNGFSPGVRALFVTWVVEGEVNNGGFNQYYWNTSGQYAGEADKAFEFFGAKKHAELMREANRIHSEEAATMEEYRKRGTLQDFSDSYKATKLGPLDERFYRIDENLSALRLAKIRSSPALFSGN